MEKSNLKWATVAVVVAVIYMIVSSVLEREWLNLSLAIVMGLLAVVQYKTWPNPSTVARRTMQALAAVLLLLIAAELWREWL